MNKKIQHLTQDSIEKYGDTKLGKAVQIIMGPILSVFSYSYRMSE